MRKLNFIGVGVSRSGTTWTWQQLRKHPEICTVAVKEAKVFLQDDIKHFLRKYDECPESRYVGEYTPAYFSAIDVPEKIIEYAPDAKLLLMLRNPTERVFTQYKTHQWKIYGKVKEDFRYWFKNSLKNNKKNYAGSNKYMTWLPYWCKAFRKKLKINLYDDLVKDPLAYIQGVFTHIGVRDDFVPPNWQEREQKPYNKYYEKHPISISKSDKSFLKNYYRQSIGDLQSFLGKDLSHWLES